VSVVSDSGHRLDSGNLFWRIQLDQDLLDTIIAIYPEWFKVRKCCNTSPFVMEEARVSADLDALQSASRFRFVRLSNNEKCFVLTDSAVSKVK
jgi:hypothetical protein